jgi:hypothetical protein
MRPTGDRVLPVGQLSRLPSRDIEPEELRVHTHVGEEEDRASVLRPGGALHLVRKTRRQHSRHATARRDEEDLAIEVRLELLVRLRQEEHLGAVGRGLAAVLRHMVLRQLNGAGSVHVHDPDFALVRVPEQRIRRALDHDAFPIARQLEVGDRVLA